MEVNVFYVSGIGTYLGTLPEFFILTNDPKKGIMSNQRVIKQDEICTR